MTESGARPWYVDTFDDTYVTRYAHRDGDEAQRAVATLLRCGVVRPERRILDLCCGAGRHLAALRDHGCRGLGLDLSPPLLARARFALGPEAPLVRADMQRLPFRTACFDTVIHMFTAFGYFAEDEENRAVLCEVARLLRPEGLYSLDVFNSHFVKLAGTGRAERDLPDGSHIIEDRAIDPVRRRVEKTTTILPPGGNGNSAAAVRRFESVRLFDRAELGSWLADAGFELIHDFGDYEGAPHDPDRSPRLWLIARRLG